MEHKNKPEKELYIELEEKIKNIKRDKRELAIQIKNMETYLITLFKKYELIEEKIAARKLKLDVKVLSNLEEKTVDLEKAIELTKEQYEQTNQIINECQKKLEEARDEGLQDLIKRIQFLQDKTKINGLKLSDLEVLNKEIDEIYKRIEKIK